MGMSNYLPNSRLSQPGVCTSATRPASPYEGMVIYETDTNQTLVWDGSAWVMVHDTDQPPGMQLVAKSSTISGGKILVENCFSEEYDAYRIVISNLRFANAATASFELYTGSVYTTSGFYASTMRVAFGTTTFNAVIAANNAASSSIGLVADSTGTSGGVMEIQNPYLEQETTFQYQSSDTRTGGDGAITGSGFLNNNTRYTGIRIFGGWDITSGTVRVYGYRN